MSNNPNSYGGSQGQPPFDPYRPNQPGSNPNNYPNQPGYPNYTSYPPNTPSNPYGTPPPPTPGGTPPPAGAPYDPYAVPPTVSANPPSNPNQYPYPYPGNAPTQQSAPNPQANPYSYPGSMPPAYNAAPPANAPRRSGSKVLLIVLAVVVILGGLVAVIGVSAHNNQVATENAHSTATTTARNTTATAQAHATATAQVNATATAIASTYPFSANLKLSDPMTDNGKGIGWVTNSICSFNGGAYHAAVGDTPSYASCYASKTNFTNFTYQADMKLLKGDFAGITFRGDNANSKRYAAIFSAAGDCILFLYTQDKNPKTLYEGTVSANITQGATLGVVARGSKITLYINNQEITSVDDGTFSSGQIGTIAYYVKNPADAQFTNVKVWQL
jgi:hypothetical protein